MATTVTNRVASQSLNGQDVKVSVIGADIADLQLFEPGMLCTNQSSSKTGTVNRVDYFGNSFTITPIQSDKNFESVSTYGYLAVGETVSVAT